MYIKSVNNEADGRLKPAGDIDFIKLDQFKFKATCLNISE